MDLHHTPYSYAPDSYEDLASIWKRSHYRFRRRFWTMFGSRLDVFDEYRNVVMHCHQKAFRLREDIRLHEGSEGGREILRIQARHIIDFGASYDVIDQLSGDWVGTLRRKGWQSMVRDKWEILDVSGNVIATLDEDNMTMAMLRRFLTELIPQRLHFSNLAGWEIANLDQHFNPFIYWLDLDIPQPPAIDPRLFLAMATCVAAIEGRQGSY